MPHNDKGEIINTPDPIDISKEELAQRIQNGEYDRLENKSQVYFNNDSSSVGRIKITNQQGADSMVQWLTGHSNGTGEEVKAPEQSQPTKAVIRNGENYVPQQPPFSGHEYKNQGSNMPSRPREKGDTNKGMSDSDYRNPANRNNSFYGPTANADYSDLTKALERQDEIAKQNDRIAPSDINTPKVQDTDPKPSPIYDKKKDLQAALDPKNRVETPLEKLQRELGAQINTNEVNDLLEKNKVTSQPLTPDKPQYDKKKDLQNALDPKNKTENPLEQLQKMLAEQQGRNQEQFASDVQKELENAQAKGRHQEALDSNAKANEGFDPLNPLSNTGRTFLQNEDIYKEKEEQKDEITQLRETVSSLQGQINQLNEIIRTLSQGNTTPEPTVPPTPEPTLPNADLLELQRQLADLRAKNEAQANNIRDWRGMNTPEQRVTEINKQQEALLNGRTPSQLSDQEKLRYFDLDLQKQALMTDINDKTAETNRRRNHKENWIKAAALIAGGAVGFTAAAAAAPITAVAGVVAVTLGGRVAGQIARHFEGRLRRSAEELKFQDRSTGSMSELMERDRRQRRNEWWANRLGEAASVLTWGSAGFGLGVAAQSLFTMLSSAQPNVPGGDGSNIGEQPGNSELPPQGGDGGGIPKPEPINPPPTSSEGILVQNGRVNLPGSAWNGNLGGEAAQDILQGGVLNHSNYTGGIHEMAARMLENDLTGAGLTRDQLLNNLGTSGTHRLLNGYLQAIQSGTPNPNLTDVLGQMGSEGAKNLLSAIK